jgi:hypothetical protein
MMVAGDNSREQVRAVPVGGNSGEQMLGADGSNGEQMLAVDITSDVHVESLVERDSIINKDMPNEEDSSIQQWMAVEVSSVQQMLAGEDNIIQQWQDVKDRSAQQWQDVGDCSVQQMLAGEDSSINAVLAVEDGSVQWWQVGDDGSVLSRLAGGDSSVQTQGCWGGSNDVGMICERSEEGAAGKLGRACGTVDGSGGYGTAGWGGYRCCVEYISYPKDAEEAVTMEKNAIEEKNNEGCSRHGGGNSDQYC